MPAFALPLKFEVLTPLNLKTFNSEHITIINAHLELFVPIFQCPDNHWRSEMDR
jgi:hypothetical protein